MPSTFFGLNIASSALNAFQAAVNTTANNISNVQTKGYSKQVANREASGALRVYQKYGMTGTGVTTTSVTSLRSEYYDTKYWQNQSAMGLYGTKLDYFHQIENYFNDEGNDGQGFSTVFSSMFNNLNSLTSHAGDENYRKNFISSAQVLATYFNDVGNGLSKIQDDCNEQIKTLVQKINASAQKIASLNKQINAIEIEGGIANELRDQRALVIDELSAIVPITVKETPVIDVNYPDEPTGVTRYVVKLDGQTLVNNFDYTTLDCVARQNKVNQTDIKGLYDIVWSDTGMDFKVNAKSMEGSLRALFDIRDGNNAENFQGTVMKAANGSITIKPSTMTKIETMTMASEGIITVANKKYNYNGFSTELDADGNIISYTFAVEGAMDATESGSLLGRKAAIGESVDCMGIPYYMGQMSEFLRNFCERFNAYQQSGVDLNGNPMGAFFIAKKFDGTEYDFRDQTVNTDGATDGASKITSVSSSYYQLNALNFSVADASLRDSSVFATTVKIVDGAVDAHDLTDAMLKLQKDVKLFRGGSAADFLQCMYSDISINTSESKIFHENFTDISTAITNQRLSISGVDEDEEALDMVKFQNAYNLASRMIQCMTEMYDKLINETGR